MQKNILKKSKRFAIFFVFFILLAHVFAFIPSFSQGKGRVRLFPAPQYARAADVEESGLGGNYTEIVPKLSVPVGKFDTESFDKGNRQNWLGQYILAWFNYLIGAIGIIAVVMIMWGGIKWITAGGNASQVDDAKGKIKNAVMGIVLLLCTYTIFKTINPRMLSLQLPTIERVEATPVCCEKLATDGVTKILNIEYNACNEGETLLPVTTCDKSKEDAKRLMCPTDSTGKRGYVINIKGPNDHPAFLEEAFRRCGGNVYDPKDWKKLNDNLTTKVAEVLNYNGEYFGCYACTNSNLNPT